MIRITPRQTVGILSLLAFLLCPVWVVQASESEGVIVYIDPGHGGLNEGAHGVTGLKEKEVVLDVALRLKVLLDSDPSFQAVLTRSTDQFLGLRERTRQANRAKAAVFLSLHANASPHPEPHGIEVYFLSADGATDENAEIVAREESGLTETTESDSSYGSIMHGLQLVGAQRASRMLADVMLRSMVRSTEAKNRGVRQANFAVLKEALMPAVVIEMGYISNPDEEALLRQAGYRERVAFGIFDGLVKWQRKVRRLARSQKTQRFLSP